MRQHPLQAPQRQTQPVEPKRHEGMIVARRPNPMWGIDATAGFTVRDGQAPIFAMIDPCPACCLGIHVARRGTRFEALEPVRQANREQFGGFREGIALGLKPRQGHGSKFLSDDFQRETRFPGLESPLAFAGEREGKGCIERFFRTLKEQLSRAMGFDTLGELAESPKGFRKREKKQWLWGQVRWHAHRALSAVGPGARRAFKKLCKKSRALYAV